MWRPLSRIGREAVREVWREVSRERVRAVFRVAMKREWMSCW